MLIIVILHFLYYSKTSPIIQTFSSWNASLKYPDKFHEAPPTNQKDQQFKSSPTSKRPCEFPNDIYQVSQKKYSHPTTLKAEGQAYFDNIFESLFELPCIVFSGSLLTESMFSLAWM
jgi:hypothetical protein